MLYLDSWQKDLNRRESLILVSIFILFFIFYENILFSRVLMQRYFDSALGYLEKGRTIDKDIIVQKSLFYQKALKSLRQAIILNPHNARPYFEYAQIIKEIGDDPRIRSSLDIKSFGGGLEGEMGFYNLARLKYIEAILREPTNAIYHQRLGSIYEKLQEFRNAEEEFRKAVLFDPQNVSVHLYLCRYFLLRGKNSDFQHHLNKVVQLYDQALRGGGPVAHLGDMVRNFLKSINKEELIKE